MSDYIVTFRFRGNTEAKHFRAKNAAVAFANLCLAYADLHGELITLESVQIISDTDNSLHEVLP